MRSGSCGWPGAAPYHFLVALLPLLLCASAAAQEQAGQKDFVSALGRIEPVNGVMRISPPLTPRSMSGVLVSRLLVDIGDDVEAGQLLAVMETEPVMQAMLAEAEAEHRLALQRAELQRSQSRAACVDARVAERESARRAELLEKGVAGEEEAEIAAGQAESLAASCAAAQAAITVAAAEVDLAAARMAYQTADLQRSYVYAPMAGRILEIKAWPGEMASHEGLLIMGQVAAMFAIAEVYETDIYRVNKGQKATISSAALPGVLEGTVERVRPLVGKQDELGTDPAARKDARVVEVEIRLDDPVTVSTLTYLQVDVLIKP